MPAGHDGQAAKAVVAAAICTCRQAARKRREPFLPRQAQARSK